MFKKISKFLPVLLLTSFMAGLVSCNLDVESTNNTVYYTVTFDADGGDSVAPIKVKSGSLIDTIPVPVKTGWNFGGWYDSEGNKISRYTSINKDLKVKAKWQVIVNFHYGQNLEIKEEKIVDIGSEIAAPAVSFYEKDGKNYGLYFWSKDKTATESDKDTKGFDLAKGSDASPIDLYSIYTEKNIRTVTFKSQDNTHTTVKVIDGEKLSTPSNPSRYGFYFSYWYKDDYKTQYDFDAPVTSDMTLNAKWNVKISYISSLKNGDMKLDNGTATKIKAEDCSEITATCKKNGESDAKPISLKFDEAHSGEDYYSYFKFEPFSLEEAGSYTMTVTNGKDTKSKDFVIVSPPQNIDATLGDAMVSLDWEDVSYASGYEVTYYKSSDPTSVKTVTVSASAAQIKGLANGEEYIFTVRSIDADLFSKASVPVTATPAITKKTSDVLMIMYMDGDNDLNDPIYLDMNEVEYGLYQIRTASGVPESGYKSVNVVALWDGWKGDGTKPQLKHSGSVIYELGMDSSNVTTYLSSSGCVLSSKTKDLSYTAGKGTVNPWLESGEVDMSSKDTLKNFLQWVQARYEATDVILQFSNHGGGPRSYTANTLTLPNGMSYHIPGVGDRRAMCWDDGSGGNTFLKTGDVSEVLADCGYASNKLSMIIEDVCLGGSIEEAYQYKDYAKYLLASPNNVPGSGLDYVNLIKSFKSSSTMETVGKAVIDKYKSDYTISTTDWNTWVNDSASSLQTIFGVNTSAPTPQDKLTMGMLNNNCATLTLVDLSKMDAIKTAIDGFAEVIINDNNTKTFDGLYYDTVQKVYTQTSGANTRPATYSEVIRELLVSYDGNLFKYMGTYTWLYDGGYLFITAKGYSDATLADGSANPNAWTELNTAATSVITALKDANVYAWRDGFKRTPLYYGANVAGGLTLSGGSVEAVLSGNTYVPTQEKYPSWYQTELEFGKDCKWGQLLYNWFHEFGESN